MILKSLKSKASECDLPVLIKSLVKKNGHSYISKAVLRAAANLYKVYDSSNEFIITNKDLCLIFECGLSRVKEITRELQRLGILFKTIKTCLNSYRYLHCTLAKLPELTTADQNSKRDILKNRTDYEGSTQQLSKTHIINSLMVNILKNSLFCINYAMSNNLNTEEIMQEIIGTNNNSIKLLFNLSEIIGDHSSNHIQERIK